MSVRVYLGLCSYPRTWFTSAMSATWSIKICTHQICVCVFLLLFSSAIKTDFSCNNSITHIFEFINITIMKLFAVWAQTYRMKSYAMNEWLYEWCPCCMNICRHKYLKCVCYTMEQKKRGQCGNKSNFRYKCFKIITRVQPTFLPSFWCLLFVLNSILC